MSMSSDNRDRLYDAWHEKLGHREYRLTVTMAGYGADPDAGEAFLAGFLEKHPEVDPVAAQSAEADSISITFSLRAANPDRAFDIGQVVWADGGAASRLEPGAIVKIEVEPVESDDVVNEPEQGQPVLPQPA